MMQAEIFIASRAKPKHIKENSLLQDVTCDEGR